jgi:hypothetical protein
MAVKFSVGVSELEEDRLLLEERRQSPDWVGRSGDGELEARPAGWPPSSSAPEEEAEEPAELLPPWAW